MSMCPICRSVPCLTTCERIKVLEEEVTGMQELLDQSEIKKTKMLQKILRLQKELNNISIMALTALEVKP